MSCNLQPDPLILLRDAQHAAKFFGVDNFRLSPKFKFLFHVSFGINSAAVRNQELLNSHKNEINMLVKAVKLPSYDIAVETVNQYNRKKVVQTTHKISDIDIKFHDDSQGIINLLWQNYYSHYYADPISGEVPGAYRRNATLNANFITAPYGLDNGNSINFFNYIKVYQLALGKYVCYTLHSPLISKWDHEDVGYSLDQFNEHSMRISTEVVTYSTGITQPGDPEGFAVEHYDRTPSPLTLIGTPSQPMSTAASVNISQAVDTVVHQTNSNAIQFVTKRHKFGGSTKRYVFDPGLTNVFFPTLQEESQVTAQAVRLGSSDD